MVRIQRTLYRKPWVAYPLAPLLYLSYPFRKGRELYVRRTTVKKLAIAFSLCAISAFAAEMKGTISDSKCGAAHADASEKSMKCAQACVKGGQSAVFVSEGKVYKVADASKVEGHVGHKVVIDGTVDGDTVKIASLKMDH